MLGPIPATWTVRGATFALWALAAASSAYWALKLGGASPSANAPLPPARAVAAVDPAAIARLLGATPAAVAAPSAAAPPSLASRLQLVGVVAGEHSGGGAAVISVDGKPARPFRVGSAIDEGLVLQSVRGRTATVASREGGPALLTLELPAPRPGVPALPAPPPTPAAPATSVVPRAPAAPAAEAESDAPPPAAAVAPRAQVPPAAHAPAPDAPAQLPPGSRPSGRLPPQPPPITAPR